MRVQIKLRQWVLGGVVIATLSAQAARADDKVQLKLTDHVGEKATFDNNNAMDSQSTVTAGGEAHPMQQASAQHRKGSIEILEVKDGTPTALRIHFDDSCSTSVSQNGQKHDMPYPLAGKTVTVKLGEDGKPTNDAQNLDPQTSAELNGFLDLDRSMYPKNAVGVGDEWDGDTTQLAKQFNLGQNDSVTLKCKLLAIGNVDGHKTADISIAGTVKKEENGFVTKVTLGGVSQFDLATGHALNADIVGKLEVNGNGTTQTPNGPIQLTVQGGGKLEVHQQLRITDGAGGAAEAAPVTPAEPAKVGKEMEAKLDGEGPINNSSPREAAAYQGTFKDATLTVELTAKSKSDLTGTITMGDKHFPATATVVADRIDGSFEADGNKFDFTATVSGNGLNLQTGGTRYQLKKPATNPLGAPAHRNPLGQ